MSNLIKAKALVVLNDQKVVMDIAESALLSILKPCPKCGELLGFSRSPCQDYSCCGIPNRISCYRSGCDFESEMHGSLWDLLEDYIDLEKCNELP